LDYSVHNATHAFEETADPAITLPLRGTYGRDANRLVEIVTKA
jgi:hypothetical protein